MCYRQMISANLCVRPTARYCILWEARFLQYLVMCGIACGISFQAQGESKQVSAAIHIDALGINDENLSISETVQLAVQASLSVAVITPHDNARVSYGLPPLRNVIRFGVERESITSFGSENYLEAVRTTNLNEPEVLTLAGVEAVPAYFWQGSPLKRLTARNLHKHMLVVGLTNSEDFDSVPSLANGFPGRLEGAFLLNLWPIGVLVLGCVLVLFNRRVSTADAPRSKLPGILVMVIGLLFGFNAYPFYQPFDAYNGDQGIGPYQAVIDHANARGALTYWAHPEVHQYSSMPAPWPASILVDSVYFETEPYSGDLLTAEGYTGFAIFEEGAISIGRPGGIWDQTLLEYCSGIREHPVWAIGELDFDMGHIDHGIGTSQTVLWLNEVTESGVVDALRRGSCYARRGMGTDITINDFMISGDQTGFTSGQNGQISGTPMVTIDIDTAPASMPLTVQIVRNGASIHTIEVEEPGQLTFRDTGPGLKGAFFYRFMIFKGGWPIVASNPIFVTIDPDPVSVIGNPKQIEASL